MSKVQVSRFLTQTFFAGLLIFSLYNRIPWLSIVFLGLTLLAGSFYCGWACPFGFLQDISQRIGKRLGLPPLKVSKNIHNVAVYFRYILAALVFWAATDALLTALAVEPRGTAFGLLGGNIPGILAISVFAGALLLTLVIPRFYCRYLCIEGARYGVFSLLRPISVRRNTKSCVNCKKCDKACPMQIEVSKTTHLHSPQCINCMSCISACPVKGALSYGLPMKQKLVTIETKAPTSEKKGA